MTRSKLDIPEFLRRGGRKTEVNRAVSDSLKLERLVCRTLGLADLAGKNVLDMGCGWRMTKALLDEDLPIGSYTGIDVFAEAIEFLDSSVDDERFNYHVLDANNEMYNPGGKPLAELDQLPLPEASFDIIWLFSVFTHLAPHDYEAMLRLLRRYVKPEGRLLFSLFLNEDTPDGRGFMARFKRKWEANANEFVATNERSASYFAGEKVPDFVDFDKKQPLKWAIYSREHALDLISRTGWEVESVNYPEEAIQHYIVCSPEAV